MKTKQSDTVARYSIRTSSLPKPKDRTNTKLGIGFPYACLKLFGLATKASNHLGDKRTLTLTFGYVANIGYSWLLENKELVLEFTALSDLERTIWMTAMEDIRDQSRKEYDRRLAEGKIGSEVEEIFGCAFYRPSHSGGGPFCSVFSRGSSLRSNASRSQPNSAREEGSMDFPHRELVDASDVKRRSIIEEEESSSARSSCSNITSAGAPSSQGSMLEFRQLFNDYQSHRKYNQYNLRCEVFDSKFEDICSTPILQVRAQARQNREAGWQEWKRRSRLAKSASMVSFSSASPLSAPFSPCPRTFNRSAGPSRSNSKGKQSYPRQQQPAAAAAADISPSIRRKTSMPSRLRQQAGPITSASPQPSPSSSSSSSRPRIPAPPPMSRRPLPTAGSVYKESMMSKLSYPASSVEERPPTNQGRNTKPTSSENSMQRSFSLATMGIARSSSRLLGRFVEKINSISTPGRARRASKTESINSDRVATSSPGRARCASRTESLSSDKAPTSSPGRTVNNSTETVNSDHGSTTSVGRKVIKCRERDPEQIKLTQMQIISLIGVRKRKISHLSRFHPQARYMITLGRPVKIDHYPVYPPLSASPPLLLLLFVID